MPRTPHMLRYGNTGQYVRVKIDGQLIHPGRHDDLEAEEKYRQLIARWALGSAPEPAQDDRPTVALVLASYLDHAEEYYAHDPNRLGHCKRLIRTVRELYADTPASEFGPKKLKVVREPSHRSRNCPHHSICHMSRMNSLRRSTMPGKSFA